MIRISYLINVMFMKIIIRLPKSVWAFFIILILYDSIINRILINFVVQSGIYLIIKNELMAHKSLKTHNLKELN